jgi:hypothetical protein
MAFKDLLLKIKIFARIGQPAVRSPKKLFVDVDRGLASGM